METALVLVGAAMLAISAAYFLRVYKTLIIDQVQNSPWLNIGIVVYFALVVAFFLGYVAEVFRGASLGLSLACILFFGVFSCLRPSC